MSLIDDDMIKLLSNEKCIIAGGCITSLFTRNEVNDIDVYFRNEESLIRSLKYLKQNGVMLHAVTSKATLFTVVGSEVPIQFIHFKYFNTAKDIFDTFDFNVCMGAYDFGAEEFIFDEKFFKNNSQRMLQFNHKTAYPIVSALRLQKYENKGYTISKPELIKILLTINNMNITSYEQIKEQLGGMYGVSYDKLYEDIKDNDKFDLIKVIERLGKIVLDDEYFKPKSNNEDLYEEVDKVINNHYINGNYKIYRKQIGFCSDFIVVNSKNEIVTTIQGSEIDIDKSRLAIDNCSLWVYKNVKKESDNKFSSYFKSSFIYEIGKLIKAEGSEGLFFSEDIKSVNNDCYNDRDGRVVLKCLVNIDDIIGHYGNYTFSQCIPIEVIHINKI